MFRVAARYMILAGGDHGPKARAPQNAISDFPLPPRRLPRASGTRAGRGNRVRPDVVAAPAQNTLSLQPAAQ